MARIERQKKILEIISKYDVDKQEMLVEYLVNEGFKATQATVSRDIKELGLIKVLGEGRKYKYVYHTPQAERSDTKLYTLFKSSVLSITTAENIVVLRTLPGGASSAAALVDSLKLHEVLGAVAGDDTIIVVTTNKNAASHVSAVLHEYLN